TAAIAAVAAATTTAAATAVTTVAAATTATTLTTAAAEGGTLLAGTGFVHGQVAAAAILAIQTADRGFHGFLGAHGHEGEATRATGFTVHHQADFGHRAELAEGFLEFFLAGGEGQVAHVHLAHIQSVARTISVSSSTVPANRVSNHH